MSAAGSQVRQSAAQAHAPQPAPRAAARSAPMYAFVSSDIEDEFKLHLNDIPRQRESLDVEGLKPSLLSRLLEMVSPIGK
ncbi:MAG TPA: hypothetical protein PKE27_09810 [Povalibacter sp.]|uniref:hypothetical protein n=1 Tax=Povalibacter sp. TaxID=1962978 RepID=UPI002B8A5B45|nr:hypothetical protein [Povalibacter sp.]HMN44858.1 hypothetical protein [Povalibacter sp.]